MKARINSRRNIEGLNIPAKANRILNVVLVAMLLIIFRIWHLAIIQYDEKVAESKKPQLRVVTEPSKRASIRDRFDIPLALNKMRYDVAVQYSLLKQIPTTAWDTDPTTGKRVKKAKRKEYITSLSNLLAKELDLDSARIEDLIHSKASFYNQIPFTIKEDITEAQYYRLKMLQRDWPGIVAKHTPKRHYPQGKIGGDIIGYMGAINTNEYESIIREKKALDNYITALENGETPPHIQGIDSLEKIKQRLQDLQELSYTVNDAIGKAGIEAKFDQTLKGYRGKKSYYSDARGHLLRELPGTRDPLPGKAVNLSLSIELQEFAEKLLIQNEEVRITRLSHLETVKTTVAADKTPWIKGGAIIAMDPNTGDIVAMASHPRIDPNDFIRSGHDETAKVKSSNVNKWFENEAYIGELWDQKRPLEKEAYDHTKGIYNEELSISWDHYLNMIIAQENPLRQSFLFTGNLRDAITLQRSAEALLALFPTFDAYTVMNALYHGDNHFPHGKKLPAQQHEVLQMLLTANIDAVKQEKRILDRYLSDIPENYDKVLAIDLARLAADATLFNDTLQQAVSTQSLTSYKEANGAMSQVQDTARKMAKTLYHDLTFSEWRKLNEKEYLKQKREEEKQSHKYAKPYIDYLDSLENSMFQSFWNEHRWTLLNTFLNGIAASSDELKPYSDHFLTWHTEIKGGAHKEADWHSAYTTLKKNTSQLSTTLSTAYLKTLRTFKDLNRPLLGRYRQLKKERDNTQLEHHLAAAFYPKFGFGYGRSQAYRQAATQGSIFKLITAYEAMVQKYQTLQEEGKPLLDINPLEITDSYQYKGKDLILGFHNNGQPIPRFYKGGRLPKSATANLGKMEIVRAIEVSSNPYFAMLAGDVLKNPNDLVKAARKFSFGTPTGIELPGEIGGKMPDDLEKNRTGLYSMAIGQHTLVVTPLQTTLMLAAIANGGKILKPKIVDTICGIPLKTELKDQIFFPDIVRRTLIDGMCKVAAHTHTNSISSLTKLYKKYPQAIKDFTDFKGQLVGKTSTAESIETIDLDLHKGTNIYTHVWFGGIAYDKEAIDKNEHKFIYRNSFGNPELVVVVYLRYGGYGKEAAPIASQIAKKWREIKTKHDL